MKPKHFSPFFSLVVVLALLLTALIPAATVSASSPSIELDEDSGEAGDTIEITGEDFTEDYYYYIFFDEQFLKKSTIDDDGEFTKSITIPDTDEDDDDYDDEEYYTITVFACDDSYSDPEFDDFDYDDDEYDEADFYLEASDDDEDIYIGLDPDSGIAGDEIEVYGEGFTEDYYYYIFFDEDYLSKKGTIDSSGEFSKTITIPDDVDPGETYEIKVYACEDSNSDPDYDDDYDEEAEADFEIDEADAAIESDTSSGIVGDTFILSGSNFGTSKTITVYWDGTKIGSTFTSTSSGSFSGKSYIVPETYYGTHTVKVADSSSTSATLTYSVTPEITLSAGSILSGNAITVSGTGFKGSSNITFYIDSTVINTTAKTSVSGTLSSTSLTIPTTTSAGSHVIKAQDASGYSASANITITVPAATTTPANNPAPAQNNPTSGTNNNPAQSNNQAPGQMNSNPNNPQPAATNTQAPQQQQPQQQQTQQYQTTSTTPVSSSSSSSSFPVWAIIFIIVAVIVIVVVVAVIIKRKP